MNSFNQIIKFYRDNGGFIHKSLYRKKNKDGVYGIFTKEKIEPNTILIKTPEKLMITINNNINYDENTLLSVKMIITILIEIYKKEKSIFYHGLLLLPKYEEIKNNLFFNDTYLNYLNECGLTNTLSDYRKFIIRKVINLNNKYNYISGLDEKNINYALYILRNYCWEEGLDLFIHLVNHKYGNHGRLKINNTNDYCCINKNALENDEEIFVSYGDIKSNEDILFNYNFIDNSENNTTIYFNYKDKSPLSFYKGKLLYDYCKENNIYINYSNNGEEIQISTKNSPNLKYLSYLKITNNNYKHLLNIASILSINKLEHINNRNNLRVYKTLKSLLKINLDIINKTNLEKYYDKFKINYPLVLNVIENRINIITNILEKVNNQIENIINSS